eukprot:1387747-Amphidinium_carterae.1
MLPGAAADDLFDRDRSLPCASLTQTQQNFWRTIQLDAHKGLFGGKCEFCQQPVTVQHIIWDCEGRRLKTALSAPCCEGWPAHLTLRGLVTKNMD